MISPRDAYSHKALSSAVSVVILLLLSACVAPPVYGPGDEKTGLGGYTDSLISQTKTSKTYKIKVKLAVHQISHPDLAKEWWLERAGELCDGSPRIDKIYKNERPTAQYGYYGGYAGNLHVEGYTECRSIEGSSDRSDAVER